MCRPDTVVIEIIYVLVDDPAPGGHPLNIPGADHSFVSDAVAMFYVTLQDIGDCLYPAMGVPRETFQVMVRIVRTEIIKHKKRIEQKKV